MHSLRVRYQNEGDDPKAGAQANPKSSVLEILNPKPCILHIAQSHRFNNSTRNNMMLLNRLPPSCMCLLIIYSVEGVTNLKPELEA